MGCHYIDCVFWALKLGYPTKVWAEGPPVSAEMAPEYMIAHWDFPARAGMPAVKMHWYDGGKRPQQFADGLLPKWGDGILFVGTKGMMIADYGRHVLLPEKDFTGYTAPKQSITNSPGHYVEFVDAITKGTKTECNFSYSGRWSNRYCWGRSPTASASRSSGTRRHSRRRTPEAAKYIRREYRKGGNSARSNRSE